MQVYWKLNRSTGVRPAWRWIAASSCMRARAATCIAPAAASGGWNPITWHAESRVLRFDEQVVSDAEIGDLDAALVDRFQAERTKDERAVLLRKLAMAAEDAGKLRPTVAGVLLGSRTPEQWLRNAFIQAVAYRGDDILGVAEGEAAGRGYQLDARDITGPLDEQVVEACRSCIATCGSRRTSTWVGRMCRSTTWRPCSRRSSTTLPLRVAARNQAVCSLLARCAVPKGTTQALDGTHCAINMEFYKDPMDAVFESLMDQVYSQNATTYRSATVLPLSVLTSTRKRSPATLRTPTGRNTRHCPVP